MSNIVIPDGGNIGSASDTDAISIPANGKPTFSAGIANTGTIDAGTIGDSVNLSNNYYLRLKIGSSHALAGSGEYINTSGTDDLYFTLTGDTTNLAPDTTNNIKVIRKGIYFLSFSATFYFGSTSVARAINVAIRGGTSVNPTSNISLSTDQIASTVDNTDYGSATCTYVGELTANYYLRYYVSSVQAGEAGVGADTHANIILIRPTA
jgi:hypothetical protein